MVKLKRDKKYSKINSQLVEDGIPILTFKQQFPVDIRELHEANLVYNEKYINSNPEHIEWLVDNSEYITKQESPTTQKTGKRGRPRKITN